MPDLERMAQDVIEATKGFVARAVAPMKDRLDGLAARLTALESVPAPKAVEIDYARIETMCKALIDAVPKTVIDTDAIAIQAADLIPKPESPDYAKIAETCKALVTDAVAEIPKPKDGQSVDEPKLREWITGQIGIELLKLPKPKDGESVHPDTVQLMVQRETERILSGWPRPKDGDPGKDALGFDDLSVEYDGRRAFAIKFQRGEDVKEFAFTLPVILDAGVFRRGSDYQKGDSVTWDGSMWIAQRDTSDKPGESDAWRLSAKRGRDGKDFSPVKAEPPQVVRLR